MILRDNRFITYTYFNIYSKHNAGVRTWVGDIIDLPNYLGWGADVFFFNGNPCVDLSPYRTLL